jgi:hexosaminidase
MRAFVIFVFSLLLCAFAQQVFPVWPYPHTVVSGSNTYNIWNWKTFQFISELKHPNIFANEILEEALKRYKSFTFSEEAESRDCPDCVKGLRVVVLGKFEDTPSLEMNEEYMLEIDTKKQYFTLQSESVWGALRGLETFSQLVEVDKNYFIANTSMMIKDKPRFKWRGLMIDSARHFLDLDTILKVIDAMSYSKFNVLHWHMVDAESFPVQIPKYPLLAEKGAYHPSAMFSAEDVKKVMVYAAYRGIRVVPEIDVPGLL